jgi:methylmalonyl-CoA epimerase
VSGQTPLDDAARVTPPAIPGVTALSHIAVATADAEALVATLAALGAVRANEELLDDGALRVVFVRLGPVVLELLEPKSEKHTVAKFLEKRGPGLHHVSFEVEDLALSIGRCKEAGLRLVNETPQKGARGTSVVFLHPKSAGGVLIELSQRPKAHSDAPEENPPRS